MNHIIHNFITMNIFKLTVLLLNFLTINSIRFKGLSFLSKSYSIGITSLIITSICPFPATAVIDCLKDCQMNCVRVAPGSESYCKATCSEYCDQTDRQDGLSGSIDASKGETGIFGGKTYMLQLHKF